MQKSSFGLIFTNIKNNLKDQLYGCFGRSMKSKNVRKKLKNTKTLLEN